MKLLRCTIFLCLSMLPIWANADVMTDILDGKYNAKKMSIEQIDSVLAIATRGVSAWNMRTSSNSFGGRLSPITILLTHKKIHAST